MRAPEWAHEQLRALQEEYHDFNPPVVPVLPYPSAISFSKQVSKSLPCVYQAPKVSPSFVWASSERRSSGNCGSSDGRSTPGYPWRALAWTAESLTSAVAEAIEVAVTPTGRADALVPVSSSDGGAQEKVFLQPASIQLTLTELLSRLRSTSSPTPETVVCYLQSQDSNLTTTPLAKLMQDLPDNFAFADDVLGEPDARNIWIGTEKSVTSVHRDPYENLYLVLRGSKTFRLWPPVDEVAMPTKLVRTGSYVYEERTGSFDIKLADAADKIPWIDLDPLDPIDEQAIVSKGARMRTVRVKEGEILYLPAGWYHHVSQQCGHWSDGSIAPCIAINFWYDMDYEGERYVMRQMVSRLVDVANSNVLRPENS